MGEEIWILSVQSVCPDSGLITGIYKHEPKNPKSLICENAVKNREIHYFFPREGLFKLFAPIIAVWHSKLTKHCA